MAQATKVILGTKGTKLADFSGFSYSLEIGSVRRADFESVREGGETGQFRAGGRRTGFSNEVFL